MILLLIAACIPSLAFCFPSIDNLSLEEKVGQLLMPCFYGSTANEDARMLIQDVHVGSIIYFAWSNDLSSLEQVQHLSQSLQRLSTKIPLLIAIDQEGGSVSRLTTCEYTIFPSQRALAMTKDPNLATATAYAIGQELRCSGIHMNLAPVVDIASNLQSSIIGIRSFGSDPDTVIAFGRAALQGYQQAHVATALKHFPGHGDVDIDSHFALPYLRKSNDELHAMELRPFQALLHNTDAIMIAHLMVPALDPEHCSSLSSKTLSLLRDQWGFQGVIISDSLTMEGVLTQSAGNASEAAICALQAGCDLLIFGETRLDPSQKLLSPQEIASIHHSIVDAVRTGRLLESRIHEAAMRVLALKERYIDSYSTIFSSQEHQMLAKQIAQQAMQSTVHHPIPPYDTCTIFAPYCLQSILTHTSLANVHYFDHTHPIYVDAIDTDLIIAFSYNAWQYTKQMQFLQHLSQKPLILIATKDPQDVEAFPHAYATCATYDQTRFSLENAVDWLQRILHKTN